MSKFKTFVDAGNLLGSRIKNSSCFGVSDSLLVLGILNGGVPVAMAIAEALGVRCDAVAAVKVRYDSRGKRGNGAVAYNGQSHIDAALKRLFEVSKVHAEDIALEMDLAYVRLIEKQLVFGESVQVLDQDCVITDDGAASGATIVATVKAVLKEGARDVLVALPTASAQALQELRHLDCQVLCFDVRDAPVFEISAAYETWSEISDEVAQVVLKEQSARTGMMHRLATPLKK